MAEFSFFSTLSLILKVLSEYNQSYAGYEYLILNSMFLYLSNIIINFTSSDDGRSKVERKFLKFCAFVMQNDCSVLRVPGRN